MLSALWYTNSFPPFTTPPSDTTASANSVESAPSASAALPPPRLRFPLVVDRPECSAVLTAPPSTSVPPVTVVFPEYALGSAPFNSVAPAP